MKCHSGKADICCAGYEKNTACHRYHLSINRTEEIKKVRIGIKEKFPLSHLVYLDGKYKHYVVDGVHVYLPHLGPREIVLANQPASLCDSSIEIQKGKPEIVLAQVDGGDGLCSLYVSKDSNNDYVAIELAKPKWDRKVSWLKL